MKTESLFSLVSSPLQNRNKGTFDSANPLYDLPSSYKRRHWNKASVDRNSKKMWTFLDAALQKPFLLLWEKLKWKKMSIWSGLLFVIQLKLVKGLVTCKPLNLLICRLQVCKSVLMDFCQSKWPFLSRSHVKKFHICIWISFAISTFVIIEERPSW